MPTFLSRTSKRISWSMVSKADERSKVKIIQSFILSRKMSKFDENFTKANSVEWKAQ